MSVPAQRSWLMVVLAFIAILVDRNPVSPRILAFTATALLLLRPEMVASASFQLSFAAVLSLVAAYEAGAGAILRRRSDERRPFAAAWLYVLGVVLTTVIASGATAPMGAWHFQAIPTFSVLANFIAVPLTSFVTMPAGLLALALMPFGLDGPAIAIMAYSVEVVLAVAHWVALLPGAALLVPQWGPTTLALFVAGGLWLALWQRRWRLLGLVPIAASILLACLTRPADLIVHPRLDMAALGTAEGTVLVLERDRDNFIREGWLQYLGTDHWAPVPERLGEANGGVACDNAGCTLVRDGHRISLALTMEAVLEDCTWADLVIAPVGPERCDGPARLIGPRALRRSDGLAVRLTADGIEVDTVAGRRGAWPWTWIGRPRPAEAPE
jgi:competence protein ComEC